MSVPARVVVHPPRATGGRRVSAGGEDLGVARSPVELIEFLRRAGLDPDEVLLEDPTLIEWRGGGPEVWTTQPDINGR
ncbi:hypothetical protein [Streptomyces hainanensis]|uniref:Uncharacterized protein n=1 Tax=Streptomyces hainanensis TaxID=402648 RepID=A0A4R4TG47_9ACTN|nr:hypothetical protein [Streptomyces hainanensis]TDC74182.1 hypothetical protein E1283_16655 [Streptomyces hainanensis]